MMDDDMLDTMAQIYDLKVRVAELKALINEAIDLFEVQNPTYKTNRPICLWLDKANEAIEA